MQLALVIGTATATQKHPSLTGQKLLVVQPQMADGRQADGDPLVVVDMVGAGIGEHVMISSDGQAAREFLQTDNAPVRWTSIGIRDP